MVGLVVGLVCVGTRQSNTLSVTACGVSHDAILEIYEYTRATEQIAREEAEASAREEEAEAQSEASLDVNPSSVH